VIQPLALVLYEELMPGSQLVNRLQDLHYRVQPLSDPSQLVDCAHKEGPMLVFADLGFPGADISAVIAKLKQNRETTHIPVIAFADEKADQLQAAAREAGATLVVTDAAILAHLPQLIEQALHAD
jgi:PleD family two-component response regulator